MQKSIFAELPNNLIIKIIQIYNDRKKYDKVVEQINMVTTYDMFCPSIREMMNDADDADPLCSASEIWGRDDGVMNDLSWLNELWWIEKLKRKERMRYEEVIKQFNKYPSLDWRRRLRVFKKARELWGPAGDLRRGLLDDI